jgi:hypothetical protein
MKRILQGLGVVVAGVFGLAWQPRGTPSQSTFEGAWKWRVGKLCTTVVVSHTFAIDQPPGPKHMVQICDKY